MYAQQDANYKAYESAKVDDANNLATGIMNGGIFSTGPGKKINVIESGRSIQSSFIREVISMCNHEIGETLGFPMQLIEASGASLSTSRTVLESINTNYAGSRQDYERKADMLIDRQFEGRVYSYSIVLKSGATETGTHSFEDTESQFKLKTGNQTDALKEAQTALIAMQTLQIAKALGASKGDVQALADEQDLGLLDLDNFDTVSQPQPQQPGGSPESGRLPGMPAGVDLPADAKKPTVGEMMQSQEMKEKIEVPIDDSKTEIILSDIMKGIDQLKSSAKQTQPSTKTPAQEEQLNEELRQSYDIAAQTLDEIFKKDRIIESANQEQALLERDLTKEKLELIRAMKGKI
jgi:hypothetical protein